MALQLFQAYLVITSNISSISESKQNLDWMKKPSVVSFMSEQTHISSRFSVTSSYFQKGVDAHYFIHTKGGHIFKFGSLK